MASLIKIKRSGTSGSPSALGSGELAYSYYTGTGGDRLYIGTGTENVDGEAQNIEVIGGKYFTQMLDHAAGTLTASSAIIVDANSKIDNLKVDNIDLDGNTISTSAGNLILSPSGDISAASNKITNVTDPTSAQDAATKAYVDTQVGASTINISDGTTTSLVDLGDSDVEFVSQTTNAANTVNGDITTNVVDNQILIGIRDTAVTAGSYGSATAVPVITVNRKGQITAASTANVSSTLTIGADIGTDDTVSLLDSSLDIVGGTGIGTTVSDNTITVAADIATTSAVGVASFAATDFNVSGAGAVTISSVSNDQLAGSIANSKLANSSISVTDGISTTGVALGGTITFAAGEGIDVSEASGTVTYTAETATNATTAGSANLGVASFNSAEFDVTSGFVEITNGGVTADHLNGTLDLTGKTVSVATPTADAHAATKKYTDDTLAAATGANLDLSSKSTDDLSEGSTNLYYTSARADSDAKNAVSVTTGSATGNGALSYNSSTGVFTFQPSASTAATDDLAARNGIIYDSANQQFSLDDNHDATFNTVTTASDVTVGGNLVVQGTTTTINTETLTTTDPLMHLADSNDAGDVVDIGFIAKYNDGSAKHTGFFRDATDGKYKIFDGIADADMGDDSNTVATGAAGYNAATMVAGTFEGALTGNVTGNVTGDVTGDLTGDVTGNVTGNVTSTGTSTFATVDINGGAIDGTVIGGTTAAAGSFTTINASSTITGNLTGDVTGNADTATALETARNFAISGDVTANAVSFDGSGNVTLAATIADAAADATTKGLATFNATHFDDNGAGTISLANTVVTGTNSATFNVTPGGASTGITFAADSRTGTTATGITGQVISGEIQIRQVAASTTVRGAALFADSDFEVDGNGAIAVKAIDGGTF